jgi:WD40 repeat protein
VEAGRGLWASHHEHLTDLKVSSANGVFLTGVHSVVVNRAEEIWRQLSATEQASGKLLFLRLVTAPERNQYGLHPLADASRRAFTEDLDPATAALAEKLARTFLLTAAVDTSTGKPTIELAHEALIHGWSRLNKLVQDHRDYLAWYEHDLLPYLRHWRDSGERVDLLLPDPMLGVAENWLRKSRDLMAGTPCGYVERSLKAAARRRVSRQRKSAAMLSLLSAVALAILAVFYLSTKSKLAQAQRFHEEGLSALVNNDMAGAEVRLANALKLRDTWSVRTVFNLDDADIRAHLIQARNRGATSTDSLDPGGKVLKIRRDLKVFAVAIDNQVRFLDAKGRPLDPQPQDKKGYPLTAAFDARENLVAYAFGHKPGDNAGDSWNLAVDGAVHIWDLRTHKETGLITLPNLASTKPRRQVSSLEFTRDPKQKSVLAIATEDGAIELWQLNPAPVRTALFDKETAAAWGLAFSPDGRTLASTGSEHVYLWNVTDPSATARPLNGHEDIVMSVDFSPDGKWVASGSADSTVRIWDASSLREVQRFSRHRGEVTAVTFDPGGDYLASACQDQSVGILDLESGSEVLRLLSREGPVNAVAFGPQGHVASGGGHESNDRAPVHSGWLHVWQIDRGPELTSIFAGDGALAAIALTRTQIISGAGDQYIKIWNFAGELEKQLMARSAVRSLALSKDQSKVAAGEEHALEVWSLPQAGDAPVSSIASDNAWAVSFDPCGKRIVVGGDRKIRLCDLGPKIECAELPHEGGKVFSIAFSPNGKTFVSGGGDNSVRLWDVLSLKELPHKSIAHTGDVWAVAYSPNGNVIASGGTDRTILLMDASNLANEAHQLGTHDGTILSLAFAPDGAFLASGSVDHSLRLWDLVSRTSMDLGVDDRPVWWVAFSPDGQYLASAGLSRRIRLWNLRALDKTRKASPADLVRQAEAHTGLTMQAGEVIPSPRETTTNGPR